jgi:hypothetical protein
MSTTTFESAEVGDKVFSLIFGWGEIKSITWCNSYPISVRFSSINGEPRCFTPEGYFYKDAHIQSLFWDEVYIEAPVKLVPTKTINGIEIPNISFKPNPGEYCYSPSPNLPELYIHVYYYPNETSDHLSNNGLCYTYTEEGKQAAIMHAKAMLGTS